MPLYIAWLLLAVQCKSCAHCQHYWMTHEASLVLMLA